MVRPRGFFQQVVRLRFETKTSGGFDAEPLAGDKQVLNASAAGLVAGDIDGTFSRFITEVHALPAPAHQAIATSFRIESEVATPGRSRLRMTIAGGRQMDTDRS
jgi:hypothetical protein